MATSLGKVKPFVMVNRTAELHGLANYPLGGVNPPFPVSGPSAPGVPSQGPLLGTDYINILNLRDYYKLPYPPVTPLATPPVIGIVSFGGGIYGQPVSSGKYSGFWKCTDISGANGAPIQILVAPINGAINAPNADDGGATLENTVDVATVNAFYGMINQGRDAPIYTPPVIILYIAPSDDMEEFYRTFYTVLKNPVICNGNSYLPSVVCCSWGAAEVAWTQKVPFPSSGLETDVNNDPNPSGIAQINEINDLFADATRRGINICVASGDIPLPGSNLADSDKVNLGPSEIMFPASSPYVTCVGGSSVFFPNGPTRNFNNPGEFAWSRSDGGVSSAFPIPDYQSNLPGSALISANAFLDSSVKTAKLTQNALGAANVDVDRSITELSGVTRNASLSSLTKDEVLKKSQESYDAAVTAYNYAKNAGGSDSATLQLQLAMNLANTALTAAKENASLARLSLADAQEVVVNAVALHDLMNQAAVAYKVADLSIAEQAALHLTNPCADTTEVDELARDAALLVLNKAVAQGAASVFAPVLAEKLTENVTTAVTDAQKILNQLVNPYDPFYPVTATALVPTNLLEIYRGAPGSYRAYENLNNLVANTLDVLNDVSTGDSSGGVYDSSGVFYDSSGSAYNMALQEQREATANLSSNVASSVVALATQAARLAETVNDNTVKFAEVSEDWLAANNEFLSATQNWQVVSTTVPALDKKYYDSARARLTAATDVLTSESVKLADAGAANLLASITLKDVTSETLSTVSSASYLVLFNGDSSGSEALLNAINDASGADIAAATVQLSAGKNAVVRLKDLANIVEINASEAKRSYKAWTTAVTQVPALDSTNSIAVANAREAVVLASEGMRLASVRLQSSLNALSVLLNNANINASISSWSLTTGVDSLALALTHVNSLVNDVNSIISSNVNAMTPANTTNLVSACGDLNDSVLGGSVKALVLLVNTTVTPFFPVFPSDVSASTGSLAFIVTDVKNMVSEVFNAEGAILYSAYLRLMRDEFEELEFNRVVSDYTAGLNAVNAIYDEFSALNFAAKKARDLSVLALNAANLANARIALRQSNQTAFGTVAMTTTLVNQAMFNAATLSTAAANAVIDYNNLVYSYSSITPSLVDAATRSQIAIHKAAVSTNVATAASILTPVTPQMVEALQGLVLKAKASTQFALEAKPTSTNLQATLALWEKAVTAGAAALAGIAGTKDTDLSTPENEELRKLFKAFASNSNPLGAIEQAYTLGTNNTSYNFPVTSDMYLTGKAAYDFAVTYFSIGVNGGNLRYVMTVANNAIVAAWNAAQVSNVAGSNPDRILAQQYWEAAANQIAQVIQAGFPNVPMEEPTALRNAVYLAYHKTTALDENGVVVQADLASASDNVSTSEPYMTAVEAYRRFMDAFNSYDDDFLLRLDSFSHLAAVDKNNAQVAIALALAAAARVNVSAKKSAQDSNALALSTSAIQDQATLAAAEVAYASADNVNMYRCIPDVAMHANVDDLPIVFRLNGGNVYVGGTSVAAAMFAGFLGVVQSHNPINYFMNPVLYNNFTYPSPIYYDLSGSDELLNPSNVTDRYKWVVEEKLDLMPNSLSPFIHGSYNPRVGLGSIRGDALSAFLETPNLVTKMVTGPYPLNREYVYFPNPPARAAVQTVEVYPGTTKDVYVFIGPSMAYNTHVTWSCSSPYNATVTQTLQSYGPVVIQTPGAPSPFYAMVYRATVTGVVPVDPLAPVPVITITSTDGSNVFTTLNVRVLPAVQVTGVSISSLGESKNPANTVLFLGNTLQLIATVTPNDLTNKNNDATNKTVYWWSSNMSIVNVDVNGLLTPLAPGHVTIKATSVNNNITASISVYVPTPMTGITASPSMITLNPNTLIYPLKNTQLIKALVTPANADYKQLTWSIVSSQALALPAGTTTQRGTLLFYAGDNTVNTPVINLPTPHGIVLKRDSSGNIVDNTQDLVTAVSNGSVVINVSTANSTDSVYGTYSANVTVNVVTPITNVTLEQTNMVIDLNPQSAVSAVNPSVDIQYGSLYGTSNSNLTLPAYNAVNPDRNRPDMYRVKATLFPAFPSNMNLIWSSSNPKVAIVSNNSPPVLNTTTSDPNFDLFQVTELITPLANGTTVIKVTTADGNKVAMVNVVVTTPVTNINLSPMPVTLNPGAQYALQATVLPTTASNAGLVWETTNSSVATVDQNGLVTAVASGSCGISVSTLDGDYTAMATINVVTPLVGVSLVLNTPTPIRVGEMVQILVVMTPTTASNQQFTWTITNGLNGSIFTNGPAQNGNIVYLDAARAGSAVFTVTTNDGNKQANLALTVVNY